MLMVKWGRSRPWTCRAQRRIKMPMGVPARASDTSTGWFPRADRANSVTTPTAVAIRTAERPTASVYRA